MDEKNLKNKKCSFAMIADSRSRLLILGSLPGGASLAAHRYYAHPRNAFWPIVYAAFGETPDESFDARYAFALSRGIALWDVIARAYRDGSLDSKIRAEEPNDIPALLRERPSIESIIFNGATARAKYEKFFGAPTIPSTQLLSTSPAVAGRDGERRESWIAAIRSALA